MICTISEFASGGDLQSLMDRQKDFSLDEAMHYFTMILFALDFLHSKGIAHLDLKPSNIFISKLKDGLSIVKIGDFEHLKVDPRKMKFFAT